jgi:hypothetical protein
VQRKLAGEEGVRLELLRNQLKLVEGQVLILRRRQVGSMRQAEAVSRLLVSLLSLPPFCVLVCVLVLFPLLLCEY